MGRRAALAETLLGPPREAVIVDGVGGVVVDHATCLAWAAQVRDALLVAAGEAGVPVAGSLVRVDAVGGIALLSGVLGVLLADAVPLCTADVRVVATHRLGIEHGVDGIVVDVAVATAVDVVGHALPAGAALAVSTSGSTGEPRVVLYDGERLDGHVDAIARSLPPSMHSLGSRLGIVLPLTSAYGLVGQLLTTTKAGGTAVLLHGSTGPAAQLAAMLALGVTGIASTSTHLRGLADVAVSMPAAARPPVVAVGSAGGPLSLRVARRLQEAFPSARLFNQYGMTEAGPRVCVAADDEPAFWLGSVGRPLPGVDVTVVSDDDSPCPVGTPGEVVVRSPWAMLGIVARDGGLCGVDGLQSQHGLRTGDVGRLDDDGNLLLDGRLDDVANVAGVRVALVPVALRLQQGLNAAFCHVVAVDDELTGSRLVALVPRTGAVGAGRLPGALVHQFTAAERPALLVGVDELPLLPSGKLDRVTARAIATAAWSASRRPAP
jgi:acyl-coenzyme A synthetase/AMP-(fatty) acid ligase